MKTATKLLLATTTSLCLLATQSSASEDDFLLGLGLGVAGAIVADELAGDDIYLEETYVEDVYVEEVYVDGPDLYVDDNGDIYVDDYDDFYEDDFFVDDIYVEDVYIEVPHIVTPAAPHYQPQQAQPRKPSQNRRKVGSTQIRGIQVRLNSLGYEAGTPDGIPGKNTSNAIARFQTSLNHPATGKLTNEEIAALVEKTSNLNSDKQVQITGKPAAKPVKKAAEKIPSIHGMTTGVLFTGTQENLIKKGYSNCQAETGTVSCNRETESLKDQITVGSIDGSVYAIQRSVYFIEPVPRKEIESRIASAYPNLINQNNMIKASSPQCLKNYQQSPSSLALSTLKTPREVQQLLAAAKSCSYLYAIEIDDQDPASRLDIVLYSAKPIQSALNKKADIFGATTEKTKDLTF